VTHARSVLAAAALGLGLLAAPPASADSTVAVAFSSSVFHGSGAANVLAVTGSVLLAPGGDSVTFTDTADLIDVVPPVADCSPLSDAGTVTCAGDYNSLYVDLNLGDDTVVSDVAGELVQFYGGSGDDTITGADLPDQGDGLQGDGTYEGEMVVPGNDRLFGRRGDDSLAPQGGNDLVEGGDGEDFVSDGAASGTDNLDGGPGLDSLNYGSDGAATVDLAAGTGSKAGTTPETDTLTGFEDLSVVGGGGAGHTVFGTAGGNHINVGGGPDQVVPREGSDIVITQSGDDRISVRDGSADKVLCGEGTDTVEADQLDALFDCESVSIAVVRDAAAERDPPGCTIGGVRARVSRRALRRGLVPRVSCDEPAEVDLSLFVRVRRVRRGRLVTARAGDLMLAERAGVAAGTRARLKPPRRLLARLPRRTFKLRLLAIARDDLGNATSVGRVVRVRALGRGRR
jgi:RTX calcium-binding nonapeptide repeat (4 copies)